MKKSLRSKSSYHSNRKFEGPEVLINNKKLLEKDQRNIMAIYEMCRNEHERMDDAREDI